MEISKDNWIFSKSLVHDEIRSRFLSDRFINNLINFQILFIFCRSMDHSSSRRRKFIKVKSLMVGISEPPLAKHRSRVSQAGDEWFCAYVSP